MTAYRYPSPFPPCPSSLLPAIWRDLLDFRPLQAHFCHRLIKRRPALRNAGKVNPPTSLGITPA